MTRTFSYQQPQGILKILHYFTKDTFRDKEQETVAGTRFTESICAATILLPPAVFQWMKFMEIIILSPFFTIKSSNIRIKENDYIYANTTNTVLILE